MAVMALAVEALLKWYSLSSLLPRCFTPRTTVAPLRPRAVAKVPFRQLSGSPDVEKVEQGLAVGEERSARKTGDHTEQRTGVTEQGV